MSECPGKKRSRKITPEDADPDKKLKNEENGALAEVSAPVLNGTASPSNGSTPLKEEVKGKEELKGEPREAFESPLARSSEIVAEEETPFMTALQEKPKKAPTPKTTPAKLVKKLDAVLEEEEVAKKPEEEAAKSKPVVKVVNRGSWFCTTLLVLIWIGSSSILGGLWLVEKLNHEMNVFQLQQEILELRGTSKENQKGEKELLDLVEEYKLKAAESESKLTGFKRDFQATLTSLETK
jgi:hypothetical protein